MTGDMSASPVNKNGLTEALAVSMLTSEFGYLENYSFQRSKYKVFKLHVKLK